MARTEVTGKQIKDQSVDLTVDVAGVLPVSNGGSGSNTLPLNNVLLGNGSGALQTVAPGAAGTVLASNGTTWVSTVVAGAGDVVSDTTSTVDSEVALFSGTGGKTLKRATGTGLATLNSGVLGTVAAPTGAVVGTTDTQTLTSKTLTAPTLTGTSVFGQGGIAEWYNTADQTTNYERVSARWTSNVFYLAAEQGGTGSARAVQIYGAGGSFLTLAATGATLGRTTSNTLSAVTASGSFNRADSVQVGLNVSTTLAQSGTAGYTGLQINATETTVGSGTKRLIDAQVGGVSKFSVDNTGAVTATLTNATGLPVTGVAATGTPSSSTYLRGDGAWQATKYAALIGDGTATTITVTHDLGTRDVVPSVYDAATYEVVECDMVLTSATTLTLTFATAPASNAYRVVVVA